MRAGLSRASPQALSRVQARRLSHSTRALLKSGVGVCVQVTPTDSARELLAAALVLSALLVLIPASPKALGLMESILSGLRNDALQGTLQSAASTIQI